MGEVHHHHALFGEWDIGIALACCSSFIGATSALTIKKGHLQTDPGKKRLYLTLGLMGMVLGVPVVSVSSLMFATPNMTAPFGALKLVWVTLLSPFVTGEQPHQLHFVAAGLIACGDVFIVLSAPHDHSVYSKEFVMGRLTSSTFVTYAIGVLGLCAVTLAIGAIDSLGSGFSRATRKVCFGFASGGIAGNNLIFTKIALERASVVGFSKELVPYIATGVTLAVIGLVLLTKGMKKYDGLFMTCMYMGSFLVTATVSNDCFYGMFVTGTWQPSIYLLGFGAIITGVTILSSLEPENHDATKYEAVSKADGEGTNGASG